MNEVDDVYSAGIIGFVEQFTYDCDELMLYVVYTYYDIDGTPLYVGRSKAFYNTHYQNIISKEFMKNVVYIGFMFFQNEDEIKKAVKQVVNLRKPKYNKRHYNINELVVLKDDFVLSRRQIEQSWKECLGII